MFSDVVSLLFSSSVALSLELFSDSSTIPSSVVWISDHQLILLMNVKQTFIPNDTAYFSRNRYDQQSSSNYKIFFFKLIKLLVIAVILLPVDDSLDSSSYIV